MAWLKIDEGQRTMTIDYHEYIQSDAWRKRAKAAKRRAKGRCQVCYSDGELHAHHRTYERLGKEWPTDLIVLCAECHALFHHKLPGIPKTDGEYDTWPKVFKNWGLRIPKSDAGRRATFEQGTSLMTRQIMKKCRKRLDAHSPGLAATLWAEGMYALAAWIGI